MKIKELKIQLKIINFKIEFTVLKELKLSKKSKNKIGYFSKRFAAKEAFAKALGTGFRNNLNLKI